MLFQHYDHRPMRIRIGFFDLPLLAHSIPARGYTYFFLRNKATIAEVSTPITNAPTVLCMI